MASYRDDDFRYLDVYYQRLFPFNEIYTWLGYGDIRTFSCREFSLKLSNNIIIRNQTFQISNHFIRRILGELPIRIDIGAIYKMPYLNKGLPKTFAEKELVFDIDISDYDNVRSCCKGPNICTKCWKYIIIACKILNNFLKFDFGYKHTLWIFSGRRGIHCWVCDKSVRILDQRTRSGILQYMIKDNKPNLKKKKYLPKKTLDYFDRVHLKIIEPEFVSLCIINQNLFGTKEGVDYFLSLLPSKEAQTDVQQLFGNHQSSIDRWNAFITYHKDMIQSNTLYWQEWDEFPAHVKLQYCSPRFDPNVTEDVTHLLKCPFSVHPETGKIAIPFDITEVELFNPSTTPTLQQLINEITILDNNLSSVKEKENINIYQETSFKKPVDIFKNFVEKVIS